VGKRSGKKPSLGAVGTQRKKTLRNGTPRREKELPDALLAKLYDPPNRKLYASDSPNCFDRKSLERLDLLGPSG